MYKIAIKFDNTAEDDHERHLVTYLVDAPNELKAQNQAIKSLGRDTSDGGQLEDIVAATNLNVKTVGRNYKNLTHLVTHKTVGEQRGKRR